MMHGLFALADAIKNNEGLASVNMLGNTIGIEQAQNLVVLLKEHPKLKSLCGNKGDETELDMSRKNMGTEDAIMLAPEIVANRALTSLNISHNNLVSTSPNQEVANTYQAGDLVEFEGVMCPVSCAWSDGYRVYRMHGVFALADAIDKGALRYANLLGNAIGAKQAQNLATIRKDHATLQSLCGIQGDEAELDMSGKMRNLMGASGVLQGADGAIMLAPEVVANGAMTRLNISNNGLCTEEAGKAVAGMLASHSVLQVLDASKNVVIYDDGCYDEGWHGVADTNDSPGFAKELAAGIKNSGTLTSLNISSNDLGGHYEEDEEQGDDIWIADTTAIQALATAIPECMLTSLNVSDNRMATPEAGKALADALGANSVLKELNVSSNSWADEGGGNGDADGPGFVQELAVGIRAHGALVSVNLLDNNIGTTQAHNLTVVLKQHATLKSLCGNKGDEIELDMSDKKMGAEGAIMLAPEIVANGALTSLNLSDNNLSGKHWNGLKYVYDMAGVKALADAIPKCK
jgi:Leucine-rich repeat (LRR) protein